MATVRAWLALHALPEQVIFCCFGPASVAAHEKAVATALVAPHARSHFPLTNVARMERSAMRDLLQPSLDFADAPSRLQDLLCTLRVAKIKSYCIAVAAVWATTFKKTRLCHSP